MPKKNYHIMMDEADHHAIKTLAMEAGFSLGETIGFLARSLRQRVNHARATGEIPATVSASTVILGDLLARKDEGSLTATEFKRDLKEYTPKTEDTKCLAKFT